MSDHTPGPWMAERDPCHYDTLSSIRAGDGALCIEVGGKASPPEQEANTLLAAAAPDLLTQLIAMLNWSRFPNTSGIPRASAEAAIAKATGQ